MPPLKGGYHSRAALAQTDAKRVQYFGTESKRLPAPYLPPYRQAKCKQTRINLLVFECHAGLDMTALAQSNGVGACGQIGCWEGISHLAWFQRIAGQLGAAQVEERYFGFVDEGLGKAEFKLGLQGVGKGPVGLNGVQ